MRPSKSGTLALAVLIVSSTLTLMPLSIAVSVTPVRLTESDISAAPYIMIYKADGNYPMNHWVNTDCMHPIICVDNNSASIRVSVGISGNVYYPAGLGTLMNAGGYLTKVSYSASWQGNHETVGYTGDATNHQAGYQFNLTGIPYGNQSISVYASGNILLFEDGFASTYPVLQRGSQSVSFTVAHTSAETTEPTPDVVQPAYSSLMPIQTEYMYSIVLASLIAAAIAITIVAKKPKIQTA
jgi:hypothetical protein